MSEMIANRVIRPARPCRKAFTDHQPVDRLPFAGMPNARECNLYSFHVDSIRLRCCVVFTFNGQSVSCCASEVSIGIDPAKLPMFQVENGKQAALLPP